MWSYALTCLTMAAVILCYSTVSSAGTGFASASTGGGGVGYGGSYSGGGGSFGGGGGGYGGTYGGAYPFVPGFDNRFGAPGSPGQISDFLQNLQSQQAASISMTSTQDGASAQASSTLAKDELFQQQLNHQSSVLNTIQDRFGETGGSGGVGAGSGGQYAGTSGGGHYAGSSGGSHYAGTTGGSGSNGVHYAGASASYGPGGGHQSVFISPPNPSVPNVHTRFDSGGSPGTAGISTSSYSSTADVNGVKSNRRGAVTSVNDNGKVTTYYTHS